jgi:alpha-tubulin suppressor-like RCC1 family protein
MSVSLGKIVEQVNAKIVAGGQNPIDTARLVGSVEALETRYSVANVAALPPAADNTGRFIYVEDIAAYRYSDGTQWTNDYDTTLSVTSASLWSWGRSYQGGLGIGTTDPSCSPVREFCSATDWCFVNTGATHTIAVNNSGQLWSWGANGNGALGDGTVTSRCSPVREISSATDWCFVSGGYGHTFAVKMSGQLWLWGSNSFCQLGNGTATSRCSPVREFCSATDWCFASGGNSFTIAIKTSGQIWSWGANYSGRLGDGTTMNRSSPVRERCSATNWCHTSSFLTTAAIKTSGQLWLWGYNDCNQIGDGTLTPKCSPVREICSATDWCHVSAGRFHTAAIKTSGELWAWGTNLAGRLGDGATLSRCSPVREFCSATDWCQVSVGLGHTAAIKTSGELWAWGCNCCGRLGDGTTVNTCSAVREISSATDWCQVSTNSNVTVSIKITKGFNEP